MQKVRTQHPPELFLFLVANIVTTSKALVPSSDALVTSSFLPLRVSTSRTLELHFFQHRDPTEVMRHAMLRPPCKN